MAYLVIEDFKGGLDKTRMAVMAKPGSLQGATNVHITRGGEIEKAKSFVETYTLPEGTFGMHSVAGVLYVFGSARSDEHTSELQSLMRISSVVFCLKNKQVKIL